MYVHIHNIGGTTILLSARGLLSQITVPSAAKSRLEPKKELLISTAEEFRRRVRDQSPDNS
jgi:hypothetical protein